MKQPISLFLFICFLSLPSWGQDLHFSQFGTTPSYINPALTGKFNGEGRIIANQRSQWRSVTIPYQTFAAAADFSHIGQSQHAGVGFSLYYDKAGDSKLTTFKADAAFSYTLNLSYNRKHSIVFGIQGGLKNISIDYNALRFDNQYNGTNYDPNLSNKENFTYSTLLAATASAGASYFLATQNFVWIAGVGVHNLITSNESFFVSGNSPLDQRLTFHTGAEISAKNKYVISPAIFYGTQGKFHEFVIGSKSKMVLLDDHRLYRSIGGGLFYRNNDAIIVTTNFEVNDFNFGISYDINTSGLRKASSNRGAFEVSVVYIYSAKRAASRRFSSCPVFI